MKFPRVPFWICLAGALLFSGLAGAQTNAVSPYRSRVWQVEDGLPHNAVQAVLQTRDGYLWAGTPQGLVRFDGMRFTVFNPQNTPEMKSSGIRVLAETPDGALWFGGDQGGLGSCREGRFTHYAETREMFVKALCASREGVLWIGTTNGLVRYGDGRFTRLTTADGLPNNFVLSLAEDNEGKLWIGTGGGLVSYRNGFGEVYHQDYFLPAKSIWALLCDRAGNLWVGTSGGGVARRAANGKWTYFKKAQGLPDLFVNALREDSRGQVWAGTMGGLCRFDGEKFVTGLSEAETFFEAVLAVQEDREGNLWLGTKEGLRQARPQVFRSWTRQEGLSYNNVMAVREDRNGAIWVATWGGGLNRLCDGQFTVYNYDRQRLYDLLLSIEETKDGSLWLGAEFDGGLYRFRDGQFTHYGTNEGLNASAIRVLHEDRQGDLWIGAREALYRMRDGTFQAFTTRDGLAGNTARALCEDAAGNFWIGTSDGLTCLRDGKFTNYTIRDGLATNLVQALYSDGERNLWIGTAAGLSRMRDGRVTTYTAKSGLFQNNVLEILEDDRGYLWMSSFAGVFRVKKSDFDDFDRGALPGLRCTAYGKLDGMASVQGNGVSKPGGWKGRDGRLWFATTRGVTVVDPALIRDEAEPPPVFIEEILADKKPVTATGEILRLEPGRGELELHYTALSFRAPEKNRFRFRLEGVDVEWVEAGPRRVAYYNNLKPGDYTFAVQGCNHDGIWNLAGAKVRLRLLPHFWQTKWFLGLVILAAAGAVAGVARYITWQRVQGRLRRLEQQHSLERERSRIARDMHDDLGACLTEIRLLSGFVKNNRTRSSEVETCIARIESTAEEVGQSLDGIVWAVNPENDSLPRLAGYLQEYVTRFLRSTSLQHRFDFPETLPEITLSSEVRHNLLLVVKEALNNLVKHSGATRVLLRLQLKDNKLSLAVEDDGRGFAEADLPERGNGLASMRKRVESMGGTFHLESAPGQGTKLRLEIPLPLAD